MIQSSNGRLPPRLAPLRTGTVQVARGSETALPGGRAACDFAAGLMSVATLLARQGAAGTAWCYAPCLRMHCRKSIKPKVVCVVIGCPVPLALPELSMPSVAGVCLQESCDDH